MGHVPRPGADPPTEPAAKLLGDAFGYVLVPGWRGAVEEATELAEHYHALIAGVDHAGVCGWVVDLRGNGGGSMWPMVAGLGPILVSLMADRTGGLYGAEVVPDSIVHGPATGVPATDAPLAAALDWLLSLPCG